MNCHRQSVGAFGNFRSSAAGCEIPLMRPAHFQKVPLKALPNGVGQHHPTVFLPLAAPNCDFASVEVEVLHS
jgi:hypothetical protein